MADIELVIKIPEEIYESSKRECEENDSLIIDNFTLAIANGTPLPKGHGRLKDVDWIENNCDEHHSDKDGSWCYAWRDIDNAPTIIEADKGENNEI